MIARLPLIVSVFLLAAASAQAGMLSVDDWRLTTSVDLFGHQRNTNQTTTVSNPFLETRNAALKNSTAESDFDISWDAVGNFDFHNAVNQAVEGSLGGWSSSNGYFTITPDVDSVLTIDAAYNYSLTQGSREALSQIQFFNPNAQGSIFFEKQSVQTGDGNPPVGTLTTHTTIPIDAGVQYILGYSLTIFSESATPIDLTTANGYLDATIRPIPEPASLLLLLAATPFLARRRRTH